MKLREVQVNVTQEHINKGARRTCSGCPIARALAALIGDEYRVSVNGTSFDVTRGARWHENVWAFGYLKRPVADFVEDFDEGRPVGPFSFAVLLPEEILKCA